MEGYNYYRGNANVGNLNSRRKPGFFENYNRSEESLNTVQEIDPVNNNTPRPKSVIFQSTPKNLDVLTPLEPLQPLRNQYVKPGSSAKMSSSAIDMKAMLGRPNNTTNMRSNFRSPIVKDPKRWSSTSQITKFPSADWTTNGEVTQSPLAGMVSTTGNSAGASTMAAAASSASSATINHQMNSQMFSSSSSSSSNEVVSSSSSSTSTTAASSKMAQMLHHAKSSSTEQQQQQQKETSSRVIEKNFSRSMSAMGGLRKESLTSSLGHSDINGGPVVGMPITEQTMSTAASSGEMTFEQKQMTAATKTRLMTEGFTAETVNATNQGMTRLQAGDVSYQENRAMSAIKEKLETDSFSAEQVTAVRKEQKQLKTSEMTQQEKRTTTAAALKLATEAYKTENRAMAKQEEREIINTQGIQTHQEKTHVAASSSSKMMFSSSSSKGVSTTTATAAIQSCQQISAAQMAAKSRELQDKLGITGMKELEQLCDISSAAEVQKTIEWSSMLMGDCCKTLTDAPDDEATAILRSMDTFLRRAWTVPTHGYALGNSLSDAVRVNGGLDFLIRKSSVIGEELSFRCACVLEQCLTTDNRVHVAENGLEKVVVLASNCSLHADVQQVRVGTGILENLFKHNERTCRTVIRRGGLHAILKDCQQSDVETLRHCASALANLALYGGPENQQAMVKHKSLMWLFPLAFNPDDTIKYFACLAVAALVANKEIEATVSQSDVLGLLEPFVCSHDPAEFASKAVDYVHGQSKSWLARLVPVLMSSTGPAKSLAAFHFAMEAGIKKKQGATDMFKDIGAVEPLKAVASSPNAIASRYAVQALQLMGEQLPHKLSQQVPLWTVEDVTEWLKQIGFSNYTDKFVSSRVDGDLLLQLTESMLQADIGMTNGILRKRFTRELGNLKKMADYESCNASELNAFLKGIDVEFTQYTYGLLKAGVDQSVLGLLTDEQLATDCCVESSIHRLRIIQATRGKLGSDNMEEDSKVNKNLDVFISYRRSNGSQLASLLKVHLQLKGFSVFIDVERLEAGKFDNNLLQSVKKAKHFLLVLTPNALERCYKDFDCKDWVHREIVAALQSQCNIIPIFDNFQWPELDMLPEDMRSVHYFNGVTWIHDYQDACVDKLERFLKGEVNSRSDNLVHRYTGSVGNFTRPSGYQRSQSNESKSSHNSDKDTKENGGVC